MRLINSLSLLATVVAFAGAGAQTPAADPSDKLREVLPADVAGRVLATIADARARELPAQALENRALKFASRGVPANEIERSIRATAVRMDSVKRAIERGRGVKAQGDEIDAGADAMRKGVSGGDVSALAKNAPSGRSLAVPLYVIGSLIDRGLPSDEALARVQERLAARASDRELEEMPGKPSVTGRDLAATKRPANPPGAGTPPVNVPRNPGTPSSGRPTAPPGSTKRP